MTKLNAPDSYYRLDPEIKKLICNGMGAKDSSLARLIPNTMYFLDVREAADIHDYEYAIGNSDEDKRRADRNFFENLLIIINKAGGVLAFFRRRRALKYYEAVHYYGHNAFWKNKHRAFSP